MMMITSPITAMALECNQNSKQDLAIADSLLHRSDGLAHRVYHLLLFLVLQNTHTHTHRHRHTSTADGARRLTDETERLTCCVPRFRSACACAHTDTMLRNANLAHVFRVHIRASVFVCECVCDQHPVASAHSGHRCGVCGQDSERFHF